MNQYIPNDPSRRKFLMSGCAVSALMLISPLSFAQNLVHQEADLKLANFLTNKQLDPQLVARAFDALSKVSSTFKTDAAELSAYIQDKGFSSIDTLKNDPLFKQRYVNTARDIISTFYLGYAGTPIQQRAHDGVEFVTYTEIETYKLTQKYTPIPGYSHWTTNYWATLPKA
ncbi:sugar dehydrogenase complex small subunit [Ignatzschineria larvae DSM 13226]|uniref:Sugar dehydrogenase complex small subunit n=1 Tax=Ignatzschineria larvae DSM 13226 TaxID=1111732 RepID=A0ABZ3BXY8_9GAMM|nr:sugar dehydrogenase complex small subunit [Ignatzschineria larvae]